MKRRIISSILVVVMLVLSLVSCGYSYTKDDLAQYVDFNKSQFDKDLKNLEFEDGEFTTNEETRKQKIEEYIYNLLVNRVNKDDQITEGEISVLDQLFYRYYVSYTDKDGNTVVLYPGNMNKSNTTTSIKLGDETLTGEKKAIREQLVDLIKKGDLKEIKEYIYSPDNTATKDTTVKGAVAYVSYVKNWVEKDADGKEVTRKETHKYERVTLGDEKHFVATKLVGSTVGTALAEDSANPLKDADGNTYTGVKVDWIVPTLEGSDSVNKEICVVYETPTELSPKSSDLVVYNDKQKEADWKVPAKTTLTYHINPAYFLEVEELDADLILKALLSNLPKEEYKNDDGETDTRARELEALKDAKTELEALASKVTGYNTAKSEYDKAVEATAKAKEDLAKVNKDNKDAYDKAEKAVKDAEADEKTKKDAMDKLDGEVKTKLTEVYKKVNADEAKAKETVVSEYKAEVREVLIDEYNAEVKANIAEAVWALMLDTANVKGYPKKAVEETYDRMYEMYQAEFYTGKNSSNKTYYSEYKGVFKDFLQAEMKKDSNWKDKSTIITDYKMAKHALWALAEEYVGEIMVIYYVSGLYDGVTYDKSEIKDYKKDESGYFKYYKDSQGETNLLAAYQFDALMDYILEVEEKDGEVVYDEVTGAPNYIRVAKKADK